MAALATHNAARSRLASLPMDILEKTLASEPQLPASQAKASMSMNDVGDAGDDAAEAVVPAAPAALRLGGMMRLLTGGV